MYPCFETHFRGRFLGLVSVYSFQNIKKHSCSLVSLGQFSSVKRNNNNKIPTVKSIRVCVFPYISTCVWFSRLFLPSS
jgi:hypothetical protein